ncbi:murein transglycosylase A [Denitratisoma oestradiolicum]|uniref:peptidoglycan lytic exotransglycosylase n=1 Tax=Denitratisoma oestradiolicum TaxID=311182 RepID=A0A6S6Y1T1_9PROT|nr:MltA domain-containing protein [Denitratisoma oestradiolicum]TWO79205.1 murein transglycosylase [Denitratisoma oestradiolicum]CAB1370851.1 Membrane-bound lytic murein transglycosylase A [Denitratisoma oestradiolicum]
MPRLLSSLLLLALLAGCSQPALRPTADAAPVGACAPCPVCQACPLPEVPKPPEKPLQGAAWSDLPGWSEAPAEDLAASFDAFRASCNGLARQPLWQDACTAARGAAREQAGFDPRAWFEAHFQPWVLVNPDGGREGLVTGYYEPLVRGSRNRSKRYDVPVFGPPEDMITVDLSSLYPELKNLRLRGRIEGRKLVPYYSRAEWSLQENQRAKNALLWVSDPVDFFFLQIQGSGQVQLSDGNRIRIGYADQNGHPYRSIGRWLIDRGELKADQASMQGIRQWAESNPGRLQELLNANPSLVFFRELPVTGNGPPGALGVPLTPERSIAVDRRATPLGAPVWLDTTQPLSDTPLRRLMLAQDTGGAIRGPVRADFYWGSGSEAGTRAGRMKQKGRMWTLLPRGYAPDQGEAP